MHEQQLVIPMPKSKSINTSSNSFSVLEGRVWKKGSKMKIWTKRHLRLQLDSLRYTRSKFTAHLDDALVLLENMCVFRQYYMHMKKMQCENLRKQDRTRYRCRPTSFKIVVLLTQNSYYQFGAVFVILNMFLMLATVLLKIWSKIRKKTT